MTSEMMPCPFCGMTGETDVDCGGSKDRWWAKCCNPKCLYDVSTNIFYTEAEAIAAWNTRTPAPAGELAALAEAWVEEAQRFPGDAYSKKAVAARTAYHTALSAHLAEVRAAIAAGDDLIGGMETLGISGALPGPVDRLRRRLAALAKKLEG